MRTITSELSSLLQKLEQNLLSPEVRHNRKTLEAVLSEDFREIGASGRVYDRDAIIREIAKEPEGEVITMKDFVVAILTIDHHGNDVAMTSYISTRTSPDGTVIRRARRTSIWLHCNKAWRIRFHQATMLE
jgi:hypothetical protein